MGCSLMLEKSPFILKEIQTQSLLLVHEVQIIVTNYFPQQLWEISFHCKDFYYFSHTQNRRLDQVHIYSIYDIVKPYLLKFFEFSFIYYENIYFGHGDGICKICSNLKYWTSWNMTTYCNAVIGVSVNTVNIIPQKSTKTATKRK